MRREGFSLVEVLVAMTIIATALTAVFRLQAQSLDLQAEARFATVAGQLGQDRMARILAEDRLPAGTVSGDFGEDFPGYAYEADVSASAEEGLYRVQVRVFAEQAGRVRAMSLETHVYRTP